MKSVKRSTKMVDFNLDVSLIVGFQDGASGKETRLPTQET